jgi:hypothetical protein
MGHDLFKPLSSSGLGFSPLVPGLFPMGMD